MPQIIAETDEMIAVDKPAGLIVHSDGRTEEASLAEWLIAKYPMLADVGESWVSPQGESVRVAGIVHRLDRTTSGVVLVAKTQEMFAYLKNEFKERRVEKVYRAFVYGHPEKDSDRIVAEIMRSSEIPKRWFARPCDESDKRAAITEWKVLRSFFDGTEQVSELELHPLTGRTHQLRVHLASIGHPILADHLYAQDRSPLLGFTRPALHAFSISIDVHGKREVFTAPLPSDFLAQ
jgi:23S rRNA pseudouridine1911/1915/1917 synthase